MILADTSIWVDHLRSSNDTMRKQLENGGIVIHPFIVAELALGSLKDRKKTLFYFDSLPHVRIVQMDEVRQMIEKRSLYGEGIGLIDAHLIASCLIDSPTRLWTRDKRLERIAEKLKIHANPS